MLKQRSLQQSGVGVAGDELPITDSVATSAGNDPRRIKEKKPTENELKIELN